MRAAEPDDGPLVRNDPASAKATALSTGERVEDLSQGDGYNFVYAEPDGTWTVETASQPVRAKDESGEWADVDTDLVERGGRLVPKNIPSDVTLSAGGDRAFAKVDPTGDGTSEDLTWQWATPLPEPVIDGPTATYPGAVPGGGDLVVTATATGFTHNVVLNEPPAPGSAPVEITVPVATPDAEIRETPAGGLEIKDDSSGKKVAAAAAPVMWDSSDVTRTNPDPAVEAVATQVVNTPAGGNIVLTPDGDFLTDPDTVYPVTIDPTFLVDPNVDTWIMNAGYTSSQASSIELRAGTYDDGTHLARSFLKFPGDTQWAGKDIISAALVARNFSSTSCNAGAIRAYRITESWSSTNITWANQPTATSNGYAQYSPAHGGGTDCPQADATFSVTGIVQDWVDGDSNYGIRLAAATETNPNSWRRYRSIDYEVDDYRPWLKVNYNTPPTSAYSPSATPLVASVPPGGGATTYTTSTRTPSVSARAGDVDAGDQVQLLIRAFASADLTATKLGQCLTDLGPVDTSLTCTISQLPNNQTVYLRAKAVDKQGAWGGGYSSSPSGWSSWRPIVVDAPVVYSSTVLQIVALEAGSTPEEVTASIDEMVADATSESLDVTFEGVAEALLQSLQEDAVEVNSEAVEAEEVVAGHQAPAVPEIADPGTDDVVETIPEGLSEPSEADLRGPAPANYLYASGDSSTASDGRIRLPKAKRYGDIAISPTKGAYGIPHGHAAIFTSYNWIAHAPGNGRRLEVVHRLTRQGRSFVSGTKMMSVYTDEGDGPLLSYEKREKAINWAKSRQGDKYRSFARKNAFRVTASVGSDDGAQNCSQLVYGAYNYANGYKFNPIEAAAYMNPAFYLADKDYVLPIEITQASQTKVYRTVYSDSSS